MNKSGDDWQLSLRYKVFPEQSIFRFPQCYWLLRFRTAIQNSITSLYPETVLSIPTTYSFKQLYFNIIYGHMWASSVCFPTWDFPTKVLCALPVTHLSFLISKTCHQDCWWKAVSQQVMQNQLTVDQAGRQEDCLGQTVAVKMWESVKHLLFSNRFSATSRPL